MEIVLADIKPKRKIVCNKDLAGGFGTSSDFGRSSPIKFIKFLKGKNINLPLLTLGYLSGIFSRKGCKIKVIEDISQLNKPDLVLVYSSFVAHNEELAFAKLAKRYSKVGFIGPLASIWPQLFLEYADFVIRGEPETWALDFDISGLTNLEGIINSPAIHNLDVLPFPGWNAFPYNNFTYRIYLKQKPIFPVLSSRGCPWSCRYYCPYTIINNGTYRVRSIENVIEEIRYLKNCFGARGIIFRDPTFTANRERVINLCKKILDEKLHIDWACETNLANLDCKLVDLMFKAGVRGINVGVETIDEDVIKHMRRYSTGIDKISNMVGYCEGKGIKIGAFYIIGAPRDTIPSLTKTLEFAKHINSTYAQFMICTPYPGTKFYNAIKDKIFEEDLNKFDGYNPVFYHDNLRREEIIKFKEKAFISYYFRWSYTLANVKRRLAKTGKKNC